MMKTYTVYMTIMVPYFHKITVKANDENEADVIVHQIVEDMNGDWDCFNPGHDIVNLSDVDWEMEEE